MSIGIVLSGGGAKGDFQVGALRFLYDQGIRPQVLCGTSVGAINAAKLAEGENPANPGQGLSGLERIWDGLQYNSDMYGEEAWLYHPDMHEKVRNVLTGRSSELDIKAPEQYKGGFWASPGEWLDSKIAGLAFLLGDGQALLKSLNIIANHGRSLYNLGPIQQKLDVHLDTTKVAAWGAAGGKLRLALVGLQQGRLRYVTETGAVLERDGSPALVYPELPAVCVPLNQEVNQLRLAITAKQAELQAAASPEKAELVAEIRSLKAELDLLLPRLQHCRVQNAVGTPARADLKQAVLASAAIPGVFQPIFVADEFCVDGGVREVLPFQVALDLGATTVYAISASPPDPKRADSNYADSKMAAIVNRSIGLLVNEISRDDAKARTEPSPLVFLIHPDEEIHDTTVVDPGLIQISRDYGYMRAADVLAGVDRLSRRWALATLISMLRKQIWTRENRRWGQPDATKPADPVYTALPAIQGSIDRDKAKLATLVGERQSLSGPMPAEAVQWARRMERHPWSADPFGSLDVVRRAPGGARVYGWVIDRDTAAPVDVHVYVDNSHVITARADLPRSDVGAAHPGYGERHGFDLLLPVPTGTHEVVAFGINAVQGRQNPELGRKQITVVREPFGSLDSVEDVSGGARVSGWVIDPDAAGSIDVHVYVNGALRVVAPADLGRPDVGAAYPDYGDGHGFSTFVPLEAGAYTIVVYALNVGAGNNNPEVGRRSFTKGGVQVQVPDVAESGYTFASGAIRAVGLVPVADGPLGKGAWVMSQSPGAGEMVPLGSTVILATTVDDVGPGGPHEDPELAKSSVTT
jgi:NTE family protein